MSKECFLPSGIQTSIRNAALGEKLESGKSTNHPLYAAYLSMVKRESELSEENVRRWHNQVEACDLAIAGESCEGCIVNLALREIDNKFEEQRK